MIRSIICFELTFAYPVSVVQVHSFASGYPVVPASLVEEPILSWRIPGTEESGGLQSWGHKESVMNERLSTAQHIFWQNEKGIQEKRMCEA